MIENKEKKKEENSKPHFIKVVDYAPEETWRTDVLIGQKGSDPHGHLALSGAAVWYLRDEQGKEIIVNRSLVPKNISQQHSDHKLVSAEDSQHSEQSLSHNEDNQNFFKKTIQVLSKIVKI